MAASRVPAMGGCPDCLATTTVPCRDGSGRVECVECGRKFRVGDL